MARKSRNMRGGYRPSVPSTIISTSGSMEQINSPTSVSTAQPESSTGPRSSVLGQPETAQSTAPGKAQVKRRPRPTHFLCLPLADTESNRDLWRSALARFEEQTVQCLRGSDQIPPGCVRPAGTMHLTLGVMSMSEEDLRKAGEFLDEVVGKAWRQANGDEDGQKRHEPLIVSLKSLVAMTRPTTSVLFADPIDSSGRLRPFCETLKMEFENAGLMEKEGRDLKLHATVLNTIYGRNPRRSRNSRPNKFDPTLLLAECENFDWVNVQIDKVAICKMGAEAVYDNEGKKIDEKYQAVKEVQIPS